MFRVQSCGVACGLIFSEFRVEGLRLLVILEGLHGFGKGLVGSA